MNIQPTETMLNLTRFQRIKFMHKYSLHNYSFKSMSKIKDNAKPYFIEYNVTEDNKMNKTKNNGR